MVTRETILSFFMEKARRPLAFREITSLLRLSSAEARALKRVLREMVRAGEIVLTRKGLYGPSGEMSLVTGYFEAHRDGYGFVISEKPGGRDIFVPSRWTSGALDNDRVVVRVENWQRRDGRIVRILERSTARIVGTLDLSSGVPFVRPKNRKVSFDLTIPSREQGDARHGDTVIAEIVSYPTDKRPPVGKVLKVIRKPEDPASEVEAIMEEFSLPKRFPRNVHDEAKALSGGGKEGIQEKRKDLRKLTTVTIDGERARDFDDAVSVALTEHGFRLWVHIADVGAYVSWDSAIDREARDRGTSVYFPDRVIPMLPRELSEDLCSLRPEVERLAFTVEMDFDRAGRRVGERFYPSLIVSNARMTYTAVRKILVDNDRNERERHEHLLPDFELMNELCGILRARRLDRGSLDFDLPEPEVLLDLQGRPEAIITAERNLAHMVIEEFMIAANEAVAEHLSSLGVPSLYRIHEKPDARKIEEVIRLMKPLSSARRRGGKPADLSLLLRELKGTPSEEVMNYLVLRSLKQARYSPVNVGHFGLASSCYTHFTSPIRRYPDLVVHRILREVLGKGHLPERRMKELEELLEEIAFHSSRMERLADEAEQEVVNAMRVWFMQDKVGEEFAGTVVGVSSFGLRIRLRDYYVDGFIHISYMTDDYYQYNEKALSLTGKNTRRTFKLGREVQVRVDRIDREDREIIFGLM